MTPLPQMSPEPQATSEHWNYVHPSDLVGKNMLIVGWTPFNHPQFRVAVYARLGKRNMKPIHFAAGAVVEQQVARDIRWPTWAKLERIESKNNRWYYKLALAETVEIKGVREG